MLPAIPLNFFFVVPSFGQMWKSDSNFRSQAVFEIVTKLFCFIAVEHRVQHLLNAESPTRKNFHLVISCGYTTRQSCFPNTTQVYSYGAPI
jgi:hypothetical protein